jgi:hypothetical protein
MFRGCPLCTERMRVETGETITRVPEASAEIRTIIRGRVCEECHYFEEAEELGAAVRDSVGAWILPAPALRQAQGVPSLARDEAPK